MSEKILIDTTERMELQRFWQEVYLEGIRNGRISFASQDADNAVEQYKRKFRPTGM